MSIVDLSATIEGAGGMNVLDWRPLEELKLNNQRIMIHHEDGRYEIVIAHSEEVVPGMWDDVDGWAVLP